MRRTGIAAVVFAIGIVVPACQSDGTDGPVDESRAGYGGMGISPPASPDGGVSLLGPETFPCQPGTDGGGYTKYGVGRMRRGGLEPEQLERDHIMIDGHGVNFHGTRRVVDGGTIEMEMDEDYFGPTVLKGPRRSDRHHRARERGHPRPQLQRAGAGDRPRLRCPSTR